MQTKFELLRSKGSLDARSLAEFGITEDKFNKLMKGNERQRPQTAERGGHKKSKTKTMTSSPQLGNFGFNATSYNPSMDLQELAPNSPYMADHRKGTVYRKDGKVKIMLKKKREQQNAELMSVLELET
jgi:hypothetical protein